MKGMDSLLRDGDYILQEKEPQTIVDIDALLQSLYISVVVPKGSFSLNKRLGSNAFKLKPAKSGDLLKFKFEFDRVLRGVLLDFDDVQLQSIKYITEDDKAKVKLELLVEKEKRELDFEFERRVD
ncbi:hypothetical protein FACS1894198_6750 [Clostridia bacterium]|nr:hypothetical protein FACS1894198_6750 [Clostridia bacterium]